MEVTFRSNMTVELVDNMGDDSSIIRAMMVSTKGAEALDAKADQGRINFLMKNRHGTPFEHASMTFYMEMPIFVFREFHRHRIGWSYNEMSGRYKELPPTFYVPAANRNLVQQGKPGHYEFVPGTEEMYREVKLSIQGACNYAYETYQYLLNAGVAKEVARVVLPVGIYSAQFATCNPRSLMAFLSLRTKSKYAKFPSFPQREIEMVAVKMEEQFANLFPLTYQAFCENGRVAP
ncbi:MAG: FAD-dependent thymidylate synthase [Saprospiraceae bacterium]